MVFFFRQNVNAITKQQGYVETFGARGYFCHYFTTNAHPISKTCCSPGKRNKMRLCCSFLLYPRASSSARSIATISPPLLTLAFVPPPLNSGARVILLWWKANLIVSSSCPSPFKGFPEENARVLKSPINRLMTSLLSRLKLF